MAVTLTDINDGTIIIVNKADINSFYELDIYRSVIMNSGLIYDVSETFADLLTSIGTGGGGGGPV